MRGYSSSIAYSVFLRLPFVTVTAECAHAIVAQGMLNSVAGLAGFDALST